MTKKNNTTAISSCLGHNGLPFLWHLTTILLTSLSFCSFLPKRGFPVAAQHPKIQLKATLYPCFEDVEVLWQEEARGLPYLFHLLLVTGRPWGSLNHSSLTQATTFDLGIFPGTVPGAGGLPALPACQADSLPSCQGSGKSHLSSSRGPISWIDHGKGAAAWTCSPTTPAPAHTTLGSHSKPLLMKASCPGLSFCLHASKCPSPSAFF